MQSSQDLPPPVVYNPTTAATEYSDENENLTMNMVSSNDMPPPVHTAAGPLHPALVDSTSGTAKQIQLHDDGPVTFSNGSLKGKGREMSASPIPAEPALASGAGTGAVAGRALSPLTEVQDLGTQGGEQRQQYVEADKAGTFGSGKAGYVQHPNGSDGWLPTESVPATHGQSVAQNTTGTPVLNTMPTVTGESLTGTSSPIPGFSTNGGFVAAPVGVGAASLARSASRNTASDGRPIPGSAFVNGAGTTGPFSTAKENEELLNRTREANMSLTPKQRSKIARNEAKHGRKLSKIIKSEAKIEKASLQTAIDELASLQQIQKNTVKSEARLSASHTQLLHAFKKTEATYLSAKLRYDREQGELSAEASALETLRENARDATEKVRDKAAEVDAMRRMLAVDERERELSLRQLSGRGMGTIRRKGSVGVATMQGGGDQPMEPVMGERRSFFGGGGGVRN